MHQDNVIGKLTFLFLSGKHCIKTEFLILIALKRKKIEKLIFERDVFRLRQESWFADVVILKLDQVWL
jgi:hypothetical protein